MSLYPSKIEDLIDALSKLPGVGKKSAQKMALNIVEMEDKNALRIANTIEVVKRDIRQCSNCFHFSENDVCDICSNAKRDISTVCVVDTPRDLIAIERTREYKGLYHVLHGAISPLNGVTPSDLRIKELVDRIEKGGIKEVILANSPTLEGESTAIYISNLLVGKVESVTRIAHGVPIGGDLEFADEITLLKSIEGRKKY